MRCLVTGASGHIGSFLTRLLVQHGHDVAIMVRPQSDLWRIADIISQVHIVRGELSTIDAIAADIKAFAPTTVFHLGWYGVTSAYRDDPRQITDNLYGSLTLLQIAQQAGCTSWIGVGSQAEYGPHSGVLNEDTAARPLTTYGVTKLSTGLLTRQLCQAVGTRYIWLRLLATYGPMDDDRHLIPSVIVKLLDGEIPALTPGEQRWDYLHVQDAAEAIYQVAIMPEVQGIFNLGSGQVVTIRSLVEYIRDLIDPFLPLGFGVMPYRPDQIMYLQADITRLTQATGWKPRLDLEEGLRQTVQWYNEKRDQHE